MWSNQRFLFNRIFTRSGDFTWRLSDCEELVGAITGDGGVGSAIIRRNWT